MEIVTPPELGEDSNENLILINGKDYTQNAQVGMVINETLTEELDSMVLVLNNVEKTLFEAFQDVRIITPAEEIFYFYVNSSVENAYDQESNNYTYTLSLISQTKILERVNLPNLKIRKQKEGSKKTIKNYLVKVLRYIKNQFPFITDFSSRFKSLTAVEECPEIEWSHPNAKQLINDLLMTIPGNPCLVKVIDNKIDYISLAKRGVDVENYSNIKIMPPTDHEQMGDFANNIVMDLREIISPKSNVIITTSVRAEGTAAEITTNNASIIIPNGKIEEITNAVVYVLADGYPIVGGSTSSSKRYENQIIPVNITDFILEEAEYNIKYQTRYMTGEGTTEEEHQGFYIKFQRGGNKISEVASTEGISPAPVYGSFRIGQIIGYIFNKKWTEKNNTDLGYKADTRWSYRSNLQPYRDLVFKITFRNNGNTRIKMVKEIQEEKDCTIYIGQNQTAVDMKALMKVQREAVNRLGNEIKSITMVCGLDSIPKLGDYYQDNYFLCEKEVAYYSDFAMVKGTFAKNYIQKNVYYGLKNRIKSTQLAQAGESVVREEFKRMIVSFKTEQEREYQAPAIEKYFTKYFEGQTQTNIKAIVINTSEMGNNKASIIPSSFTGDKSFIVTGECEDNYSVGWKVSLDGTKQIQHYVTYANRSTGEFSWLVIELYDQLIPNYNDIEVCREMPGINIGDDLTYREIIMNFNKDNAETLKITYQFDFISKDESVIIGDGIGQENSLSVDADISKAMFYICSENIDSKYPVLMNVINSEKPEVRVEENSFTFINTMAYSTTAKSYALVDENGEIIIAVNRKENGSLPRTLYINVKGENE